MNIDYHNYRGVVPPLRRGRPRGRGYNVEDEYTLNERMPVNYKYSYADDDYYEDEP